MNQYPPGGEEPKINVRKILSGIHTVLNEPVKVSKSNRIGSSERNSPADNTLRELLLAVHEDSQLAEFVKDRRYLFSIYDSDPDSETAYLLDWRESRGKVQFVYRQPVWGVGHGGAKQDFELDNGRFYVRDNELLDLFPNLTAQTLEDGIKKAIKEDKEYKIKNPSRSE
jgi:hypothetical protein